MKYLVTMELAQGTNMPRIKTPKMEPPAAPWNVIVAYYQSWFSLQLIMYLVF